MRLAGKAKAGFYPTPPEVMKQILSMIDVEGEGECRVLDTCCGEGTPLKMFKEKFPTSVTYGVEIDATRYQISKANADFVLNCDSIGELRATNEAFDVLFLNPPYDYDKTDVAEVKKSVRLEKKFAMTHQKYLSMDGLFICIIPFYVLQDLIALFSRMNELKVLSFPEKYYGNFKQIVVIGRMAKNGRDTIENDKNHLILNKIITGVPVDKPWEYLETTENTTVRYKVKPCSIELKSFHTSRINPDDVIGVVESSVLKKDFLRLTKIQELNYIQPLLPLNQSHLAILITAGMIDGYLESGNEQLVVKGIIESENKTVETDKDVRLRKIYTINVRALDLNKQKFINILA